MCEQLVYLFLLDLCPPPFLLLTEFHLNECVRRIIVVARALMDSHNN